MKRGFEKHRNSLVLIALVGLAPLLLLWVATRESDKKIKTLTESLNLAWMVLSAPNVKAMNFYGKKTNFTSPSEESIKSKILLKASSHSFSYVMSEKDK